MPAMLKVQATHQAEPSPTYAAMPPPSNTASPSPPVSSFSMSAEDMAHMYTGAPYGPSSVPYPSPVHNSGLYPGMNTVNLMTQSVSNGGSSMRLHPMHYGGHGFIPNMGGYPMSPMYSPGMSGFPGQISGISTGGHPTMFAQVTIPSVGSTEPVTMQDALPALSSDSLPSPDTSRDTDPTGTNTSNTSLTVEQIKNLVRKEMESADGKRKADKLKITGPVRIMLDLVGVNSVRNEKMVLPEPLPDGAPLCVENNVPLYNPHWKESISLNVNHEYLEAVVDHIVKKQNVRCTLNEADATPVHLWLTAETYFTTLHSNYKAQTTVNDFQARYSEENTVGVQELLHSDYMSSEHSDSGEAVARKHNTHEEARGIGRLEFNHIIGALETLSKEAKSRDEGRATKLRICGSIDNNYTGPPPKNKPPFESCISTDWAHHTGTLGSFEVLANSEDYTIFLLAIPDNDLPQCLHRVDCSQPAELGNSQSGDEADDEHE
ncbi:uncharacterized protein PHACADRAFT_29104 [Phanerochaete carnosa HHB-10118-sp]|uniref:Uncharacterized protein n=1 Tax=Phanerochaete carnosa (strain HHB-10118-sp) TaxID=650164 RepID=K5V0Z2_PHACS|nr:uncharacterized protein PHACADRAFT_29104 [Phanerochaete carnosa HHB-10118-sp]EKM56151.1 hypothetical protein PHACADRAFT_29104 [Phanerochaete carnosa HHB-10118-sp]